MHLPTSSCHGRKAPHGGNRMKPLPSRLSPKTPGPARSTPVQSRVRRRCDSTGHRSACLRHGAAAAPAHAVPGHDAVHHGEVHRTQARSGSSGPGCWIGLLRNADAGSAPHIAPGQPPRLVVGNVHAGRVGVGGNQIVLASASPGSSLSSVLASRALAGNDSAHAAATPKATSRSSPSLDGAPCVAFHSNPVAVPSSARCADNRQYCMMVVPTRGESPAHRCRRAILDFGCRFPFEGPAADVGYNLGRRTELIHQRRLARADPSVQPRLVLPSGDTPRGCRRHQYQRRRVS